MTNLFPTCVGWSPEPHQQHCLPGNAWPDLATSQFNNQWAGVPGYELCMLLTGRPWNPVELCVRSWVRGHKRGTEGRRECQAGSATCRALAPGLAFRHLVMVCRYKGPATSCQPGTESMPLNHPWHGAECQRGRALLLIHEQVVHRVSPAKSLQTDLGTIKASQGSLI